MTRKKRNPFFGFVCVLLVVLSVFILTASRSTAALNREAWPNLAGAASLSYQGQTGDWDTAVEHEPWSYGGRDVTLGDEHCYWRWGSMTGDVHGTIDDCNDFATEQRLNQPDKVANLFEVTPWVHKFEDSDPYHDWYLLDLTVSTDANVDDVEFIYERSLFLGWYSDMNGVKIISGDPQNVFLIDWAPKHEAKTWKESRTVGFSGNCGVTASKSPGVTCTAGFNTSKTTMTVHSDVNFTLIEQQHWTPQTPDGPDYVFWVEDTEGPAEIHSYWGLPEIAWKEYESNRMVIWETSEPLDGALLEMFMWAIFRHDFKDHGSTDRYAVDMMCLGVYPGPEDHYWGCITDHDDEMYRNVEGYKPDDIKVGEQYAEMFRMVQYRPPEIEIGQMPSSTSPVWVNQSVDVSFNPAHDPDGDYLLYQFDFGDGTHYPSDSCAADPSGDGCGDEVVYEVCMDKACDSTTDVTLGVQCDVDGCFGPKLTVQHTWTVNSLEDLIGNKNIRVRAAEAHCFPDSTGKSPCVEKAIEYGFDDNYNYKSGWSDSFPVTINGLSSISIENPISGYLFDDSFWTMQCIGKWYNDGTPSEWDCSECDGGLSWAVTDSAGNSTNLASIDTGGYLDIEPLPSGERFANIMVTATCIDHGLTKTDSISLGIENDFVVVGGQEVAVPNAPLASGETVNDKLSGCETQGESEVVGCIEQVTESLVNEGVIDSSDKDKIDQSANKAYKGKEKDSDDAPLLTLIMGSSDSEPVDGEVFTFTIEVNNPSSQTIEDISIRNKVDNNLTLINASTSHGTVAFDKPIVTTSIDALSAGETVIVTLEVTGELKKNKEQQEICNQADLRFPDGKDSSEHCVTLQQKSDLSGAARNLGNVPSWAYIVGGALVVLSLGGWWWWQRRK